MHPSLSASTRLLFAGLALLAAPYAHAQMPGELPALGDRITQDQVANELTIRQVRQEGRRIFSTPFNRLDGLGTAPNTPALPVLGGIVRNGAFGPFTRVFGLDSQSCTECHSLLSADEIPNLFDVGGAGQLSTNEIISTNLDLNQPFVGNFFNPIANFGSGGGELVGREMTTELQALKAQAIASPGVAVSLVTKGVSFGSITCMADGSCDMSAVEGIMDDLVVRPFGHKGATPTFRMLSTIAATFHFSMEPVEFIQLFGVDEDNDGDGVVDELTIGEISAMHVWSGALAAPVQARRDASAQRGFALFTGSNLDCAGCHVPSYVTESPILSFSFPEVFIDPTANVYRSIDLRRFGYRPAGNGVRVEPFSDFKVHDMGPELADTDPLFITAKLWGVADSAPYLHDGRAPTLTEAILAHGGEAAGASAGFAALSDQDKIDLLTFLRTLRNPRNPDADIKGGQSGGRGGDHGGDQGGDHGGDHGGGPGRSH